MVAQSLIGCSLLCRLIVAQTLSHSYAIALYYNTTRTRIREQEAIKKEDNEKEIWLFTRNIKPTACSYAVSISAPSTALTSTLSGTTLCLQQSGENYLGYKKVLRSLHQEE
jgi:hypothetical protein